MQTEMRESGLLDVTTYSEVKENKARIKKSEMKPKQFPAKQDEIRYPGSALKIGNPLY